MYNQQQITNIAEESYRTEGPTITPVVKQQNFSYDANGNLLSINTGTINNNILQTTNSRKMLWDEENRLLSVSDNGFVSNYWYDASGERTVKESSDGQGVFVNGMLSGAQTGTTNFTAYISPYLIVNNGGNYTKHIYMGGQRITSKVSNSEIFTASPVTTTDLQAKYTAQTAKIKERFDSLGVVYKGTAQSGGLITKNPTPEGKIGASYFYHSDHLGSSSLITDQSGDIVQHLEYVPFGETFIDERKSQSSWTTPYLFSGKERDEETGLLYFGARYQDSKYGIWYSVDPLAEKYPNISSYVYCLDNPIKLIDTDGRKVSMYFAKSTVGVGMGVGFSISLYRGTAYDNYGVTHFTLANIAHPENLDDNYKPALVMGAGGYMGGVGGSYDWKAETFKEAIEKWGFSMGGGGLVTGAVGFTSTSEDSADGINAEIGFLGGGLKVGANGGGNLHYVESISVSYGQAKMIGGGSWFVENKKPIYDKNGKITGYSGTVFKHFSIFGLFSSTENTGIEVQSGISVNNKGKVKSDGVWTSRQYKLEQNINKP